MIELPEFTRFQKRVCIVISVIFTFLVGLEAVKYLRAHDSVDLCNKVIGARLIGTGTTPYFYFWKEGDSKDFYNPYETLGGKANGITVPPSTLLLMKPLSYLSFSGAKWSWFFISYLLAGVSIYLFSTQVSGSKKVLVWCFSLFFFLSSTSWLLHLERGQNYIFYLGLLSALFYFYQKKQIGVSLFFLCMLIWLRLPFVFFGLPFLSVLADRKHLLQTFVLILFFVGVTLLGSSIQDWQAYATAVEEWSIAQIAKPEVFSDATSEAWRAYTVGEESGKDYLISNSSLQYLLQYHLKLGLKPTYLWIIFALTGSLILWVFKSYFKRSEKSFLFLIAFLLYSAFEVCIPAPRYNYNYLQWLFPFLLLLTAKEPLEIKWEILLIALVGLLLSMGLFFFVPRAMVLGEALLVVFVGYVLWIGKGKNEIN